MRFYFGSIPTHSLYLTLERESIFVFHYYNGSSRRGMFWLVVKKFPLNQILLLKLTYRKM